MIQRMLASALFAGGAAGLVAALLHFAFVQKPLLLAEEYESGALVHFEGAGHEPAASAEGAEATAEGEESHTHAEGTPAHDHPEGGEVSTFERNAKTVLAYLPTYIGYAMILVAGMALASQAGIAIGPAQGVLWGIAGFVSFQFAPALGLAPELPGTPAADLAARQVWWWSTVAATGAGLALMAYGRSAALAAVGVVLLAIPHLVGAPEVEAYAGVAPPELAATFAARALGVGLAAWAVLGWLAARLWSGKTA